MPISEVKPLKLHLDARGYLYEVLRCDDECFSQFGQVYVSAILPGVVKGFHKHSRQTDYITCVHGQIKLVLVEDRPGGTKGQVEEHHLSVLSPKLVVVPPGVYHGWENVGNDTALVLNTSTQPFDPDNIDEVCVDAHDNPWNYVWGR